MNRDIERALDALLETDDEYHGPTLRGRRMPSTPKDTAFRSLIQAYGSGLTQTSKDKLRQLLDLTSSSEYRSLKDFTPEHRMTDISNMLFGGGGRKERLFWNGDEVVSPSLGNWTEEYLVGEGPGDTFKFVGIASCSYGGPNTIAVIYDVSHSRLVVTSLAHFADTYKP